MLILFLLFFLACIPVLVYLYVRKNDGYLHFNRSEKAISFLSLCLVIYFAIGVVILAEMGLVYLASLLVGGIHFTGSFSLVATMTLIVLFVEVVYLLMGILVTILFKKVPNWLVGMGMIPLSAWIIYSVSHIANQKVSLKAAFMIAGLMFVANFAVKEKPSEKTNESK